MPQLSKNQIALRIIAIISAAELLIMWVMLPVFQGADGLTVAILDGVLLAIFATPLLYFWVIRPFVDDRDEALAEVTRLASIDSLTELPNRRQVLERLGRVTRGGDVHRARGAVLLVDLDGFKRVNDLHGHDEGDAVLFAIARRLSAVTRADDVVGRLGGDEFVVLVNRLGADERTARDGARQVADKLLQTVRQPLEVKGKPIEVSASIGVRLLGFDDLDADTALHEADIAMYRAKQAGKGRVVFFERTSDPSPRGPGNERVLQEV